MKLNRYTTLTILLATLIIIFGVVLYLFAGQRMFGAVIEPPKPLPDFTLSAEGGAVSLSQFRGRLVLLYFGYTNCPDICPTSLGSLGQALNLLDEKQAADVQVIFVSVDPQRDTPEKLANYARMFYPSFIGLTGTPEQIDVITKNMGVYYRLNEPDANGYYVVEHSSSILALDREGRLMAMWSFGQQPSEIASDLRILLRK